MNQIDIEPAGRVANVEKVMEIFEALSGATSGLGVAELAKSSGISVSAVSRLVSTLCADGYVIRDTVSGRCRLGLKFLALGARYADKLGIESLCLPVLQDGAKATGELLQLALIEENEMRYLLRADGDQRVRVVSILGEPIVPHAFAAGKIWLAHMATEKALKLALDHGLNRLTPHTITDVSALQKELELVRSRGFALNLEEVDLGLSSIAVPIVVPNRPSLAGALALSAPTYRQSKKSLIKHVPLLQELSGRIGECLLQSPTIGLGGRANEH
jgi:IclR family acetate operon transcriptional repressor